MWPEKIQAANFSLPKISEKYIVIWLEIVEYLQIVIEKGICMRQNVLISAGIIFFLDKLLIT